MTTNFGSSELILIADAVSREKNIPKDMVIEALEDAIRVAARRKYGHEKSIRAEIDRKSGEIRIFRDLLVVDKDAPVEEELIIAEESEEEEYDPEKRRLKEMNTITLEEALFKKPDAKIGDIISESLPPIDLGRVAAQSAKQVITHRIKEVERERNYNDYKDKVGKIVSGVVEKVEYGNIIVRLGSAEAMIKNDSLMREERGRIRQGERIRALVYEVNKDIKGAQILLSRVHNEFLAELFTQEVPEIYDKIIEIKAVARDPGSRAKIAVYSNDSSIDPVGSCVGMRGSRVQAVINELGGEKIDIIQWSSELSTLVVNALLPAEVGKVIIDEEKRRIEVVVPDEQLSIAIGKRGQNVRLASKLLGWEIDVLTEESESKRRTEEFSAITQKFISALDLEEILAQLLASEGYTSIQQIADASQQELANTEGLDEGIAEELISRAKEYAASYTDAAETAEPTPIQNINTTKLDATFEEEILNLPGINEEVATRLFDQGIKNMLDIADLSRDEFIELLENYKLNNAAVDKIIMTAREKTYFNTSNS